MSRIFQPRERIQRRTFASDIVGRFRGGTQINRRPVALEKWRVTTGDPEVAEAIRDLLGGEEPQEWAAKGEDKLEVFTEAKSVEIVLDGPKAIDARMVIWPRGAKSIVTCDKEIFETEGEPYVCESGTFTTRAEHDEQGHVCEPHIRVRFRLAENTELGLFEYVTQSWSLASTIGGELGALYKIDGPALATLALEEGEAEIDGRKRKFYKPVLTVGEAAELEEAA